MKIQVSYIIPCIDITEILIRQIEDIIKNENENFEILIIDDSINQDIKFNKKKVKVLKNKYNKGPSAARNLGAANSKGEFLFFIDSDVFITNRNRSSMITSIKKNKSQALMGMYDQNSPYKDFFSNYKNIYWSFNHYKTIGNKNNLCTAIFLINRKVFNSINGFDENIRIGEDREFGNRLIDNGFNFNLSIDGKGQHFKKFNWFTMFSHHFNNAKNIGFLFLNRINQKKKFTDSAINKLQLKTMLITSLFISNIILLSADILKFSEAILLMLVVVICFVYFMKEFFSYTRKYNSFFISTLHLLIYFVEQVILIFGLFTSILIYFNSKYILRNMNNV